MGWACRWCECACFWLNKLIFCQNKWVLDINKRGPGNKKPRPEELVSKELASKNWAFSAIPIYCECNGVLSYSDLLGLGVLGYSDLLGLGVPDEWLLDLP